MALYRGMRRLVGPLRQPWTCRCLTSSSVDSSLAAQFKQATATSTPHTTPTRHAICRTNESNPANHNSAHEGLYYTIPPAHVDKWLHRTYSPVFYKMTKAFTETCLMVRKPALDLMTCLKAANYSLPVIRYILYGPFGSGKSVTLSHAVHFCGSQGWMVMHIPWPSRWNKQYRETQPSTHKPDRFDLPVEAAEWLSYFKQMNESILKDHNICTSRKYVWSKREATEEGASLLEAIDFAIGRPRYASDILGMVLKEVRDQTAIKGFKVLVAVDGVNSFWENTRIKREEDRSIVNAENISLVHNFKKMLKNNWTGGAVVGVVDPRAGATELDPTVYTPRSLLGKQGFEWLDPFIPVEVQEYTDKEAYSCLEYYSDRHWITNPKGLTDEGRKEILFLSNKNPLEMYVVTRPW